MKLHWLLSLTVVTIEACAAGDVGADEVGVNPSELRGARAGAVFTISNERDGNRVIALTRAADGSLEDQMSYATGGMGTGDSLGSQAALALTEDHRFLLAVDAGSNELTSFAVNGAMLERRDRVDSGGTRPVSVTARDGLVYVVHAGDANNVAGFSLDRRGHLHALPHASKPLSADMAGPAQVALSPDARELVVTEKMTNKITSYRVGAFGHLADGHAVDSAGQTPFGFDFTSRGELVVSEAGTTSTSSYALNRRGVSVISGPISDTQMAPCWVVVSPDDGFAYVANAGSASVSSYSVAPNGEIALLDARAGELAEGGKPLDMTFAAHGRYLYVLDRGNLSLAGFEVEQDGSLAPLAAAGELTEFASGVVGY